MHPGSALLCGAALRFLLRKTTPVKKQTKFWRFSINVHQHWPHFLPTRGTTNKTGILDPTERSCSKESPQKARSRGMYRFLTLWLKSDQNVFLWGRYSNNATDTIRAVFHDAFAEDLHGVLFLVWSVEKEVHLDPAIHTHTHLLAPAWRQMKCQLKIITLRRHSNVLGDGLP